MSHGYTVAPAARADIRSILIWSQNNFGAVVRGKYEDLVATAIDDIVTEPFRTGGLERSELGTGVRSWHLALSKDHVAADTRLIAKPRHVVFYRDNNDEVQILRILHDAMDFARHRIG